jgi:aspartate/methionine/tyrosine aminotransferase
MIGSRPPLVYRKTEYVSRQTPVDGYLSAEGLIRCAQNPDIINLGTAENHLIEDVLLPLFQERPDQPAESLTYRASLVDLPLRTAFAKLLRDYFGIPDASPSHLLLGSGISFLGDRGGCGFLNPEDAFLITVPYYTPMAVVIGISGATCIPIDVDNLPPAPPPNARLLQLVNPGNPIGRLVPHIEKLLAWAMQKPDLHVICDEIYALSNRAGRPFRSIVAHPAADPLRVHMVYSLSKDWGLGGLHMAFFFTKNPAVLEMMRRASGAARLSSDTQWICLRIFGNESVRDEILRITIDRMRQMEQLTVGLLRAAGIEFIEVEYCPFLVIDLSEIAGESAEREIEVWRELRDEYRVHVMPCEGCFHYRTGWFRVCFGLPEPMIREGMARLVHAIREIRTRMNSRVGPSAEDCSSQFPKSVEGSGGTSGKPRMGSEVL